MDKTNAFDVVQKEIDALFKKPLNAQSVDLLYKLTSIQSNIKNGEIVPINAPQTRTGNGKLDRNINELFFQYVESRKRGNKAEIEMALGVLMDEMSDLVVELYNSAMYQAERNTITEALEKMKRH